MAGVCGVRKVHAFKAYVMQVIIICLCVSLITSVIMPLIKFSDIVEYTEAGTRCLKEGEAVCDAEHIIMCGLNDDGEIVALCLQTSNLKGAPHSIKINLSDAKSPKQWICTCSCKAGAGGKCKHIVATLIFSYKNELDQLSCTDLEQVWGKKKIDSQRFVEVKPMKDFCHVKKSNVGEVIIDEQLINDTVEQIISAAPNSNAVICPMRKRKCLAVPPSVDVESNNSVVIREALKLCFNSDLHIDVLPSTSLAEKEQQYYIENITVSLEEAENYCIQTIGQNSKQWKDLRMCRITGSRCYELYTYCKNKNPNWKTKLDSFLECTFKGNSDTDHGTMNEADARKAYAEQYGEVHQTGLVINPKLPWLACSPDGLKMSGDQFYRLIEIKCPSKGKEKTVMDFIRDLPYVKYDQSLAFPYFLNKKHKYYGQVHLGMALLNLQYCDFIVYCSFDKSFAVMEVERDDEFIETLIDRLHYVYFNFYLQRLMSV